MLIARITSAIIGYICGLFLSGYFYGKTKNVDVREMGSGNVGTTNTLRNLGWKAGAVTLIGDIGKVFVAIFVTWLIFHNKYPQVVWLFEVYAGFGAVIGHDFPVYMKFKGGKGIASTGGMVLGLCPFAAPVSLGLFILMVLITGYVSLGSILGLISLFIQVILFGEMGLFHVPNAYLPEVYILFGLLALLGIMKHHENIKRLLNGTENKFGSKKKHLQSESE